MPLEGADIRWGATRSRARLCPIPMHGQVIMASHSRVTHSRVGLGDEEEEETAQRNITFWRNGFSIEGGGFYGYADPENERLLEEMNTGRAPVSVLDVRPGQPVEVVVSKRTTEIGRASCRERVSYSV